MTRTEAIMRAVCEALDRRRGEIDAAADLSYLVVEIVCRPGQGRPRKVMVTCKSERMLD